MVLHRYLATIARDIRSAKSFRGRPRGRQQQLELDHTDVHDMIFDVPGIPVCYNHDEKFVVGRVRASYIAADGPHKGSWMAEYELDDATERGREFIDWIHTGNMVGVSLQHMPRWNNQKCKPLELSLCWKGARPHTETHGRIMGRESNTGNYSSMKAVPIESNNAVAASATSTQWEYQFESFDDEDAPEPVAAAEDATNNCAFLFGSVENVAEMTSQPKQPAVPQQQQAPPPAAGFEDDQKDQSVSQAAAAAAAALGTALSPSSLQQQQQKPPVVPQQQQTPMELDGQSEEEKILNEVIPGMGMARRALLEDEKRIPTRAEREEIVRSIREEAGLRLKAEADAIEMKRKLEAIEAKQAEWEKERKEFEAKKQAEIQAAAEVRAAENRRILLDKFAAHYPTATPRERETILASTTAEGLEAMFKMAPKAPPPQQTPAQQATRAMSGNTSEMFLNWQKARGHLSHSFGPPPTVAAAALTPGMFQTPPPLQAPLGNPPPSRSAPMSMEEAQQVLDEGADPYELARTVEEVENLLDQGIPCRASLHWERYTGGDVQAAAIKASFTSAPAFEKVDSTTGSVLDLGPGYRSHLKSTKFAMGEGSNFPAHSLQRITRGPTLRAYNFHSYGSGNSKTSALMSDSKRTTAVDYDQLFPSLSINDAKAKYVRASAAFAGVTGLMRDERSSFPIN